jgi:hypothetical protein
MNQQKFYDSIDSWKENQKFIFIALHLYKCPLYNNLYNELEKQMPADVLNNIDRPDFPYNDWWK